MENFTRALEETKASLAKDFHRFYKDGLKEGYVSGFIDGQYSGKNGSKFTKEELMKSLNEVKA